MVGSLKINVAIIICLTFLFRLLFINVGIISSLNSKQNSNLKVSTSTFKKENKSSYSFNTTVEDEYPATEICEENSNDEDDFSKKSPFILLRVLYSFFINKTTASQSNSHFDSVDHKVSSKKYLAISVIRI